MAPRASARALEAGGRDDAGGAPTSKKASSCASAGMRAPILVFGALSVSDLDGVFDHDLTPTISSPAAGRALQAAAAARGATLALSPQDRHRHEPSRLSPRQPAADAAGAARQPEPRARGGATRISRTADEPEHRCSTTQRTQVRDGRAATLDELGARPAAAPRRQLAPRCCATRASGSTSSGPGCCSTAWCRRRWRRRFALRR